MITDDTEIATSGVTKSAAIRNLYGQVLHQLGQRIVNGQVLPGEILPREDLLAESMQVSRTALREALKVLSAKGLIESRAGVGTRVREPRFWNQLDADVLAWRSVSLSSDSFIEKLIEMREIIEPAAAEYAARRRTADQLSKLEKAYASMESAATLKAWASSDLAFHHAIVQATGNELLWSLFSVVETALGTFFVISARTAENFKYSLPEHRKVLEAIRRRQPNTARNAMLALIVDSKDNLRRKSDRSKK